MFTLSNELYYYHLPPLPTDDAVVPTSTPIGCFPGSSSSVHANLNNMDSVFFLGEGDRSTFLHTMMQFFGSTYICLWSYDQSNLSQTLFNFLRYMDGLYNHERSSDQPNTSSSSSSSSSGSLAQLRFNEYRQSLFIVDHNNRFIPGHALVNNIPYLELKSDDLLQFARVEAQRQFYQAAGIKTAVFMGCNAGEIELGFSDPSQVNIEKEMRNWFPDDFSRQLMLMATTSTVKSHDQQNKPASSSSSLRSLSYDSPEYPPPPPNFLDQQEPIVDQHLAAAAAAAAAAAGALKPSPSIFTTSCTHPSLLISQIRSPQIPSIESEDDAMAKAMLAVICSNNNPNIISNNNFHFQPQQNFPVSTTSGGRESAFKWYGSASSSSSSANLGPKSSTPFRRQNMLKKSIAFLRSIHAMRSHSQEHNNMQTSGTSGRTSSTQLHHMISERKRREKLNESFQALRSLLPTGTKKDKASVLTGTTEYLSSLKAEVAELSRRNAILEAQILPKKIVAGGGGGGGGEAEVGITEISELATTSSSTGARLIDLHVTRIGEINITDLLVSLLEFLKTSSDHRSHHHHHHHHQISLMSVEANTTLDESSNSINRIVFRLKFEGEWDESAFQEAVRRIVNNQMPQ